MKFLKKYYLTILIIFTAGSIFAQVAVVTPNGGESLEVGSTYHITWTSTGVTNVKLEYSVDSGNNWVSIIASTADAPKDYSWTVPATISATCEIQISDADVPATIDVSDAVFSIVKPSAPAPNLPLDEAKKQLLSPTISWAAVPSATQYLLEISEDPNIVINKTSATVNAPAISYAAAVLSYNKTYYWHVRAVVGGINSDFSTTRSFETKISTPTLSTPSDLSTWIATNANLTWNAVGGAENYTLQVSTDIAFPNFVYNNAALVGTSQAMNGLSNNQTYYWRVKATQADGNESDFSTIRSFSTIPAPTLTSPADLAANYKFTKVTYNWAVVANAVSYELKVSQNANFTVAETKTYTSATNTYTPVDLLVYARTYYWKVNAKVGTINSDYSPTYSFTVGTPSSLINDGDAIVSFDHTKGTISELTFLHGSGNQLLNTSLNTKSKAGLGRILNEENSKLVAWTEAAGSRVYTYENTLYGSKTLTITWNATGIVLNMVLNLDANKAAVLSPSWLPGGATGPLHDFIVYAGSNDLLSKATLTYPGVATTLFTGGTVLTAMYDDRYDEFFGFKSATEANTKIQQAIAFGPTYTYDKNAAPQVINLSFAVMSKSDFFTWANKKYIIVNAPTIAQKILDQSTQTLKWDYFGFATDVDIKLSIDGGTTFPLSPTFVSALNDGSEDYTLPDLSANVPLNNCKIQVSSAGVEGNSAPFSIVKEATSVISIADNFTVSPSGDVTVPIVISPADNTLVNALDIRLMYDKEILSYKRSTVDAAFDNWTMDVTNNASGGFLQIGGFKNDDGLAINTQNTIVLVTFTAKSTARVGVQTGLKVNNLYLSLADESAKALSVSGVDGLVTIYSGVSGYFRYIINKKPIYVTGAIKFENTEMSISIDGNTNAVGKFDFSNIKPGSDFVLTPKTDLSLPDPITLAVDAVDARKAFDAREGGTTPFQNDLQKMAADINGDGIINSTDAFAILQISTGALTAADFNESKWIFVDSTFKLTSSNWQTAPNTISYTPLDTLKARQTFWGVIRGDADGDYSPSTIVALSKIFAATQVLDPNTVMYSTPQRMTIKPGDTLSLPIYIKLNGSKIAAFNISVEVNPEILAYTNKYSIGNSIPAGTGWSFSTHFDSNGKLNIGATDFVGAIDPISQDGLIAFFKFVVKGNPKLGDSCGVKILNASASDAKYINLSVSSSGGQVIVSNLTDVSENNNIDFNYSLNQNYPNPFNPSTFIEYSIKNEGLVKVDVYNVLGELVISLVNKQQNAGKYKVEWNASQCASGIYFYRINSGEFVQTRKMLLIK
ncbi:MAG: cohesin domain-containing protein [Ignavibacteriales bacterium]|nr:cohesin domain-containing protein [Ignavibacteriales bacterium]